MFRVFTFVVEATKVRNGKVEELVETLYIAAYSYEQAKADVKISYSRAGWGIKRIISGEIYIKDIRDYDDQTTH